MPILFPILSAIMLLAVLIKTDFSWILYQENVAGRDDYFIPVALLAIGFLSSALTFKVDNLRKLKVKWLRPRFLTRGFLLCGLFTLSFFCFYSVASYFDGWIKFSWGFIIGWIIASLVYVFPPCAAVLRYLNMRRLDVNRVLKMGKAKRRMLVLLMKVQAFSGVFYQYSYQPKAICSEVDALLKSPNLHKLDKQTPYTRELLTAYHLATGHELKTMPIYTNATLNYYSAIKEGPSASDDKVAKRFLRQRWYHSNIMMAFYLVGFIVGISMLLRHTDLGIVVLSFVGISAASFLLTLYEVGYHEMSIDRWVLGVRMAANADVLKRDVKAFYGQKLQDVNPDLIHAVCNRLADGSYVWAEAPARHHRLLHQTSDTYGRPDLLTEEQGFVTVSGEFKNREESLRIIKSVKPVLRSDCFPSNELFSENIS